MKTVVITGGNKGLGLAQTALFISHGWQVFVVARTRGDLDSLAENNLHFVQTDLLQWQNNSYLADIHSQAGRIDALINNAGMHLKKTAWEVCDQELEDMLSINVKALFKSCAQYISLQKNQGGAIVNISSMGGVLAMPSAAAYVTAKTAVIGLTRSIAVDSATLGFRCNAVLPGFIDTAMTRAVLEKDLARRTRIESRIPSGKFGTANDVANATFFLCSNAASYINGVALPVDNGYCIGF